MTDDDLDRALFALPMEEPPADLRGRILAATALRPAPTFRVWELVLLAFAVLGVSLLTFVVMHSDPHAAGRLVDAANAGMRAMGLFNRNTYIWLAIGISSVWWISSLTFITPRRPTVYNR